MPRQRLARGTGSTAPPRTRPRLSPRQASMPFTPLRVHSHGSLLAGVASPEALASRAAELGYEALALTDRDNLYLAVRFLRACADRGLAAFPGAELTAPSGASSTRALLLPFDRRGWAHLCALLTARHLEPRF